LIEEPTSSVFSFSTTARNELLRLTMRHPYLIQAVSHELFSFMVDNRLSVVSRSELDRVIRERVFQQPTYFQFQVAPLQSTPQRRLVALRLAELLRDDRRIEAAAVAARMGLEGYEMPDNKVQETLGELVDEGILVSERGSFRFRFPIVGEYFVSQESGA
jgi:hypothetical protein